MSNRNLPSRYTRRVLVVDQRPTSVLVARWRCAAAGDPRLDVVAVADVQDLAAVDGDVEMLVAVTSAAHLVTVKSLIERLRERGVTIDVHWFLLPPVADDRLDARIEDQLRIATHNDIGRYTHVAKRLLAGASSLAAPDDVVLTGLETGWSLRVPGSSAWAIGVASAPRTGMVVPGGSLGCAGAAVSGTFEANVGLMAIPLDDSDDAHASARVIHRASKQLRRDPLVLVIKDGQVIDVEPPGGQLGEVLTGMLDNDVALQQVAEVRIGINECAVPYRYRLPAGSNLVYPGVHVVLGGATRPGKSIPMRLAAISTDVRVVAAGRCALEIRNGRVALTGSR